MTKKKLATKKVYRIVDPKKIVKPILYKDALSVVNMILARSGLLPLKALPKGRPGDACGCPLQVALTPVGVTAIHADCATVRRVSRHTLGFSEVEDIELPETLTDFVAEFDSKAISLQEKE